MKYITEEELRDLCNIQEFETFTLTEGVKLTPGGRQFLVDRKIPIIVQGEQKTRKTVSIPTNDCDEQIEKCNCVDSHTAEEQCVGVHFTLLEAIFFRQAVELFERNQALANQIYDMKCCLESIACSSNESIIVPEPCDGMTKEQLKCPQKECFQIRRDVMFSEHGKEAAVLHLLRCELQKFYFDNTDILSAGQKNNLSYLMNRLSQMIHRALGREHCLRDAIE